MSALFVTLALLTGALVAQPHLATPPLPAAVLGFEPGEDYLLADFRQLREYFHRLDEASRRVRVLVAGHSTGGNEILVAVVSSETNLARLDEYRSAARQLAGGRLTEGDARALARAGRAIVWIDSGLHASEVATAQHALMLAHEVATSERAVMREIRDNVILVLLPCVNPDGMNLVVDWYRRHRGTPYQDSPLPHLYQTYVGHDNNRDFFMQTQRETQVLNRLLYEEWLPQIMYNHHQGIWPTRMFVPPFPEPVNPQIDPEVMRGVDDIGEAIRRRLEGEGKDGVISRYGFSAWYNGSIRTTAYFHNMIGILTETAHASATPHRYESRTFPRELMNGVPTLIPSRTYPSPWRGGMLRLRDAMEYMRSGSLAVLEYAARQRERLLYGAYDIARRQIQKGREAPIAYVIPVRQHDVSAARAFLDVLVKGGVEVHRARRPFEADGVSYAAGTHVVLLAQPFRPFVRDLVEPHRYPDVRRSPGEAPAPPYDTAGWTLSYQMGVRVVPIARTFDVSQLVSIERSGIPAGGDLDESGSASWGYAINPTDNAAFVAVNRLLARGLRVQRVAEAFSPRPGVTLPPGAWIVRSAELQFGHEASSNGATEVARYGSSASRSNRSAELQFGQGATSGATEVARYGSSASRSDRSAELQFGQEATSGATEVARYVRTLVRELGLRAWTIDRPPDAPLVEARRRRVGLYSSWVANIDEGWTRWLAEQYEFGYVTLRDQDIRSGRLRDRLDVIVLPDQAAGQILKGHQPDDDPPRPGPWGPVPPEYRGGIGNAGLDALKTFVRAGGTLVVFDRATELVLSRFGGILSRITDRTARLGRERFYCPGSVVRISVQVAEPAAWGMEPETAAFFHNSRAFTTSDPGVRSIARYAGDGRVLLSGWLHGEEHIAGQHAVLDVPYGDGRVVLFGFRPQFRAQPHATFKLLFNLLL